MTKIKIAIAIAKNKETGDEIIDEEFTDYIDAIQFLNDMIAEDERQLEATSKSRIK